MKRDDVVLPIETEPTQAWKPDVVREGMNHYYNRDPDALWRLLERLRDLLEKRDGNEA